MVNKWDPMPPVQKIQTAKVNYLFKSCQSLSRMSPAVRVIMCDAVRHSRLVSQHKSLWQQREAMFPRYRKTNGEAFSWEINMTSNTKLPRHIPGHGRASSTRNTFLCLLRSLSIIQRTHDWKYIKTYTNMSKGSKKGQDWLLIWMLPL